MAPSGFDEKLLRRRQALVTIMVALTVLVLVGFTLGSWRFLQRMGEYLEAELGRRLLAVATLTSEVVTAADFHHEIEMNRLPLIQATLRASLGKIQQENKLQGVYLVAPGLRLLAGSPELFAPGERLSFLREDSTAMRQAFAGLPTVAPMHLVAGNRFKSAYAPVTGSLGDVLAVVVVQANAGFFDLLGVFQRGLILGGVISTALVVLFSAFLFWAIRLLMRTQESLRRSERLAAMGQMAATVAHEIRNPLGIIKGTADVLNSKYNSVEQPDELFEFIPSEVRRLNRLVSDFLTFARDRDLELRATELRASVERSLSSLQDEMRQAQVKLKTDFDDLPPVKHDEDAVNQIMLNLALNAIQAMDGGGTLTVRLKNEHAKKGRKYIRVEVEDTGCGFEVENEKIFEPFYTTRTSGSGLGLSICRRLVEKHGGRIEAESEKDRGTKIRFFLPAAGADFKQIKQDE